MTEKRSPLKSGFVTISMWIKSKKETQKKITAFPSLTLKKKSWAKNGSRRQQTKMLRASEKKTWLK